VNETADFTDLVRGVWCAFNLSHQPFSGVKLLGSDAGLHHLPDGGDFSVSRFGGTSNSSIGVCMRSANRCTSACEGMVLPASIWLIMEGVTRSLANSVCVMPFVYGFPLYAGLQLPLYITYYTRINMSYFHFNRTPSFLQDAEIDVYLTFT